MTTEPPPYQPPSTPGTPPPAPFDGALDMPPPSGAPVSLPPPLVPSAAPPLPPVQPAAVAPPGYVAPPSYGAPPQYATPPQYAPPMYGAPPAYGTPPGHGAPPAYGAPTYGGQPPYGGPPVYGAPPIAPVPPARRAPSRRNRVLVSLGSVVTVALVGLGAAAIAFGGGGASSPEEAVEHLATAIGDEDVLAAVATLAPDETRSLPELVQAFTAKSKELDLGGRFNQAARGSGGGDDEQSEDPLADVDVQIDGLELRTTELSDDIAKVEIIGGTLTWDAPHADVLSDLQPGYSQADWCQEMLEDGAAEDDEYYDDMCTEVEDETELTHDSVDFGELHREADADRPGVFVMALQRDGGWYASPLFTAAEYARVVSDSDADLVYDADPGPAAGSPTQAVEAFAAAAESVDPTAVANALASELSVWRVYGAAVDDGARTFFGSEIKEVSIDGLQTSEERIDDDRVRVVIDHAKIEFVTSEPDYEAWDDESYDDFEDEDDLPRIDISHTLTIDGTCITTEDDEVGTETECLDESAGGVVKALGVDRVALVAVTDRDGWAVSPIETLADYLRTVVDHLDGPLVDRILGAGDGTATREPDAALSIGTNQVELDSAGVAVLSVELGNGEFVHAVAEDDDVRLADLPGSTLLTPADDTLVVVGPVGAGSVEVEVTPIEATAVSATAPDGSLTAVIEERVHPDEVHAVTMSGADYRRTVVSPGYALIEDDLLADGSPASTYDDPEDLADDDVVTVVLRPDPNYPPEDPEDDVYTITFLPATGGFAGADPTSATVDIGTESEDYGERELLVVAGQPVDLVAESFFDATLGLYCDSGQFLPDDQEDYYEDEDYTRITAGQPFTRRLEPTQTEICYVWASPPYEDDYLDTPDEQFVPPDLPASAPVVLRLVPVAP